MKYKLIFQTFCNRCLLLTTILVLLFSSCNRNVLDETPLDFLAPKNAYNTIAGIQQGITGLHFGVRDTWYGGSPIAIIMTGGPGTDFAFYGEDPGGSSLLSDYVSGMTAEYEEVTYWWDRSYAIIQRANVLIAGINEADEGIWTSDTQKNAYLAEAMFFRAWIYRFLVQLFGDIPLVSEVVNSAKSDFVRAPKADIYQLIESDLIFAAANLPDRGKTETPGRISKGAAWHTLTECYLAQSKFQLAVDAASKVIDGGEHALMKSRFGSTIDVFGSGDVFLDLFAYGNQNLSENKEAIWVIQIEPLITGGLSYPGERAWGPAYFRMGNTPDGFKAFRGELVNGAYTGYSDTLGRPVGWMRPTNYTAYDIWRSDWNNDIRNAKHSIKRDFYFDNPASAFNKKKINFSLYTSGTRNSLNDTCQYIYPFYMKHADPVHHFTDPARSGGGSNHKDVYVIRLAETILLRAEAYIGLGNMILAAADINAVRNRAKATPVLPANVNLDYLLDERARELYAEEYRPITLRRTGKLLERVRKYNNNPINPASNIRDHNVLYPIPQSQIDLNVNAVIQQNPGY